MRQVQATSKDGLDGVKVVEVGNAPTPGPGEVQITLKAAGANFFDLYTSYGVGTTGNEARPLGLEGAGIVSATGTGSSFKIGDRVVVHCPGGGAFADVITISDEHVMLLPDAVSFDNAACITVSYLTAHFALHHAGGLRENGSVFIHSVAGSVGWAATQLAQHVAGVTVVGTAAPAKAEAARNNGVHHVICDGEGYVSAVKSVLPGGASVVLDSRAGPHLRHSLDLLQPLGKVVIIGAKDMITSTGTRDVDTADVSPLQLVMNNAGVAGLHIAELQRKAPAVFRAAWARLLDMAAAGEIKPKIYKKFPLTEAREACRHILHRLNVGKVVLEIQ